MKRILLLAIMSVSVISFAACGGGNKAEQGQQKAALVNDVNVDEFKRLIEEKPGTVLDVRTPGEVAEGKVPGATVINIQDGDFMERIAQLDKSKPVYVYCKAGGRSANASQKLVDLGFPEVYNMMGGMDDWKRKGYAKE